MISAIESVRVTAVVGAASKVCSNSVPVAVHKGDGERVGGCSGNVGLGGNCLAQQGLRWLRPTLGGLGVIGPGVACGDACENGQARARPATAANWRRFMQRRSMFIHPFAVEGAASVGIPTESSCQPCLDMTKGIFI